MPRLSVVPSAWKVILPAALAVTACGDLLEPTIPGSAVQPQSEVTIAMKPAGASITTAQYTGPFALEGAGFEVTVEVTNPGKSNLKDVSIVARMAQPTAAQPTASRQAGAAAMTCPGATAGTLPGGATCSVTFQAAITNSSAGTGTLTEGAAEFELSMVQGKNAKMLDSVFEGVTITGNTPSITSLQLQSTTFVLDNGVQYTITVENPGAARTGVVVQALVTQGTAERAAGGVNIGCPTLDGNLPTGTCTFSFPAVASNNNSGSGDLVPGAAELVIQLIEGSTILDTETAAITIGPDNPYVHTFSLTGSFLISGTSTAVYTAVLRNPHDQLYEDLTLAATILQGDAISPADELPTGCLESGTGPGVLEANAECTTFGPIRPGIGGQTIGTLVPGAALLRMELKHDGVTIHSFLRAIVLE